MTVIIFLIGQMWLHLGINNSNMKTIHSIAAACLTLSLLSCGGDKKTDSVPAASTETATSETSTANAYDPKRGIGKHENVDVSTFDPAMAAEGRKLAEVKCTSCHKPTEEKLVGPGWKGVTQRQTPEWIMNFISNPDPMIDVDPELQKQLELCLVRMPNQGLADNEARQILEYMREIDGAK